MPKNIVVFSDGTGQEGGVRLEQQLSNVYKLYRVCRVGPDSGIDPLEQVAFYDAGLGTDDGATALTGPVRFFQKLLASVTGRGITTNIAECYEFIINHYEPGDRIFLIGFSRGAYTVRAVADLIRLCGIPKQSGGQPLPLFRKAIRDIADEAVLNVLEHGAGHPRQTYEDEREELARRFRDKYESHHESGEERRSNAAPYFIGVFDTVASLGAKGWRRRLIQVGFVIGIAIAAVLPSAAIAAIIMAATSISYWPAFGATVLMATLGGGATMLFRQRNAVEKTIHDFPNKGDKSSHLAEWKGEHFNKLLSRFVSFARSANAIDETRADFPRLPWGYGKDVKVNEMLDGQRRFEQIWFAGNHSDIGGSYPEQESRLSDIALQWMVEEATRIPNGIKIDGQKEPGNAQGIPGLRLFPSAGAMQHCEVISTRDKLDRLKPKLLRRLLRNRNWKVEVRPIDSAANVHPTVRERFDLPFVVQCAGSGPYRPAALSKHNEFKHYYTEGCEGGPSVVK